MSKKSNDEAAAPTPLKSFAIVDTHLIYCDDDLEQLKKLPDDSVDFIYVDPPFKSPRKCGIL